MEDQKILKLLQSPIEDDIKIGLTLLATKDIMKFFIKYGENIGATYSFSGKFAYKIHNPHRKNSSIFYVNEKFLIYIAFSEIFLLDYTRYSAIQNSF